ncbi:Flp pilus assembly protein CpaB [Methylorubrum extorquens]|jgi:pilus assembly protein CpaB|uniref:Pilus assembly protein cpaB n=2 Tax=Methylorubrum extorquens TaxID=408 RepID=C7CM83_METED|nr:MULTISPECIES: Flp pilus assembly protein CpaB [Methylobacteriaceae]KQO94928.1 Flp pilus assembly protein CpaB [Methylobacterium sp. Leaf92]KQP87600.1 Flp pilus assembly protein CpaB [Methylobacterium sp. Leaf119]KQP99153.1 Flp pilus assembly protein CpaB [Methylobacterium sp. Leaf121]ABY30874.1 Flp pilus assembly protein CpaB [Methylorubrum extorquens PA1]APX87028.1 Flp pilus assembly protein CpaB [Methylorubrum extorquens]
MKPARLAVLGIALVAGCGAALLMQGEEKAPEPAPVAKAEPVAPVPMSEVLVAAAELPMGQTLKPEDLRWIAWPEQAISPGLIERRAAPKGLEDSVGAIIRTGFSANEPIRPERLVKAGSGFMSAILPPGMRAVAITTDTRGSSSAGGFVLPNDHVDVIKTSNEGTEQFAETLLTDVRVLAVGQIVQEKNGANVVTAETATLALTPSQAETVTLAQKVGQLSLVLRSIQDSARTAALSEEADMPPEGPMTVVRFGVAKQQRR